jgi:ubiquinone/menaquinone biosynthesis C-methylase UbiE
MSENKEKQSSIKSPQSQKVCPWWLCFTFDNFLRRMVQNPDKIVKPYIQPGWTVLDVGPGMGYFTITMARLVEDSGKVIAADLQKEMLNSLWSRAEKAGVQKRVQLLQCSPDKIGIEEPIDFCLAFWMLHEVPDQIRFLAEISSGLKTGALFLLAEPKIHVSGLNFNRSVSIGRSVGLSVIQNPPVFFSHTALFKKN